MATNQKNGKVKLGIVGAGGFAGSMHYPTWSRLKDVELLAVCDINAERAKKRAEEYNIPYQFQDMEKMLDSIELDAVVLCLRPKVVFDIAMLALNAKKHVFMEKPPGMNSEQTRKMTYTAEANSCFTQVGFNRRFTPVLRYAREKVTAAGKKITSCSATYNKFAFGAPGYDAGDNLLVDGVHAIDTLLYLAGSSVKKIYPYSHREADGLLSRYAALIEFENGCVGTYMGNYHAGVRYEAFEVHSDRVSGYIRAPERAEIFTENKVFVNPEGEVVTDVSLTGTMDRRISYGYEAEMQHFIDVILGRCEAEVTLRDSIKVMDIVETILKAAY